MRVALISDIHGNLLALEKVLADLEDDRPNQIVCLGDVATAGPWPRETVERLRDLGCQVVMGNADAELLQPAPRIREGKDGCRVREIIRWCSKQLPPGDLAWIRGFRPHVELPLCAGQTLLCFHGSPRSFDEVIVATTPEDELDEMLLGYTAAVMAGGHTHEQSVRHYRKTTVLNCGSVGWNPFGAEYALIECKEGRLSVELRRLTLPVEEIRQAILTSSMPHAEWWASFWKGD